MRVLTLAVALSMSMCFVACAPRNTKTHFDRWAEQTAKRKEEEALQKKEQEWLRSMITGKSPAPAMTKSSSPSPGDAPRTQAAPSNYSSLGARTSTGSSSKSRVIKPSDQKPAEEDEAIY